MFGKLLGIVFDIEGAKHGPVSLTQERIFVSKEAYLDIANEAARLERAGDFKPAEEKWLAAQNCATKGANVVWCEHRAETCKLRSEKRR